MNQSDKKEVENLIGKNHAELLEYCNEIAERVNELSDHFVIMRERIQELESNGNGKINKMSKMPE